MSHLPISVAAKFAAISGEIRSPVESPLRGRREVPEPRMTGRERAARSVSDESLPPTRSGVGTGSSQKPRQRKKI
jgi:hypothetical protein